MAEAGRSPQLATLVAIFAGLVAVVSTTTTIALGHIPSLIQVGIGVGLSALMASLLTRWLSARSELRNEPPGSSAQAALQRSEARYRSLVEDAPVCIHEISLEGRVTDMNAAGLRMIGAAERSEVVGVEYLSFVEACDRERVARFLDRARAGERVEFEFCSEGPEPREFASMIVPVRGESGEIVKLMGVTQDLTDRHRNELAMAESEERFAAVFRSAPTQMLVTARDDGTVLEANECFITSLGYTRDELIGHPVMDFDLFEENRIGAAFVKRLAAGETIREVAIDVYGRDRDHRIGLLSADTIQLKGRACVVWHVMDITEHKRAEEALHQRRKLEAVGLLAGGIAHDFNNLLTVIGGYTDSLLDRSTRGSQDHSDLVQVVEASAEAGALTGQLLAFSRKERREPKLLDLNAQLRQIEQLLRRVIDDHVELEVVLDGDAGRVEIDPAQLRQIILNLSANSRDAMPEGGVLRIETRADESAPLVHILVSDTGAGMEPEACERAFEPFFTTKEVGAGTGLGLATVFGIVEQNGGVTRIESSAGIGTRIDVTLPRVEEEEKALTEARRAAPAQPAISGKTILVVEDKDMLRRLLFRALEARGYRILQASNGLEALEVSAAHQGPIDLVLTDAVMPKMGGVELEAMIREQRPETRVALMSGYPDPNQRGSTPVPPDATFIRKPFSMRQLADTVREILERPPA